MNNLITIIILGLMIIVFVKGYISKDIEKRTGTSNYLAALGIIGTFVGITIALYHFDVNEIETSIPELMGGLKTAFVTSVAGLILSNIFKAVRGKKMEKKGKSKEKVRKIFL